MTVPVKATMNNASKKRKRLHFVRRLNECLKHDDVYYIVFIEKMLFYNSMLRNTALHGKENMR